MRPRARRVVRALAAALLVAAASLGGASVARASAWLDYALHCRGCHLEHGEGTPGSVPVLRGAMGRFLRVPGGRAYLVRVPGAAQSALDDAALAALLDWMLRELDPASLPADFTPYTAQEVARERARVLADPGAERRALEAALARLR